MAKIKTLCARLIELWDADCDIDQEINQLRDAIATPQPATEDSSVVQPADGEVAKLVAWLRLTADEQPHTSGQGCIRLTRAASLLERLSPPQPVPEGVELTDKEIEEWADASAEVPLEALDPDVGGWQRCFNSKEFCQMVRAALARFGNATTTIESD